MCPERVSVLPGVHRTPEKSPLDHSKIIDPKWDSENALFDQRLKEGP